MQLLKGKLQIIQHLSFEITYQRSIRAAIRIIRKNVCLRHQYEFSARITWPVSPPSRGAMDASYPSHCKRLCSSADREYIFHSRDHFHTAMCIRIPALPCLCAIHDIRCGGLLAKHFLCIISDELANFLYRWLSLYGMIIAHWIQDTRHPTYLDKDG